ncbi:LysE family translocator [Candidatus Litorirhabdus singularis]|uniref:LysE family translocator n=1 Tax=Candidatus Litorirhabdus singularis TaxID=2518993 RepID=UPI00243079C8|nr:LysE family translocator [Candidatus Litorirhabdus singularis]
MFAIVIFAFSATITPGPNNIMMMASGVNFGIRSSLPHYFGICLGFPAMVALVGLGFGFIFEAYPVFHEVIKVVGIVYLIYLSWLIANSAPQALDSAERKPLSFLQAVLFQWVNPKAWIMATGAVATYTSAGEDIYAQVLLITAVFFAVLFPCVGSWLVFGVWLKKLLRDPLHQRLFNICMALLLLVSIAPIAYELVREYAVMAAFYL